MSAKGVRAFIRRRNRAWRWHVWRTMIGLDVIFAAVGTVLIVVNRRGAPQMYYSYEQPQWLAPSIGAVIFAFLAALNILAVVMTVRTFRPLRDASGPLVAHTERASVLTMFFGLLALVGPGVLISVIAWSQAGEPAFSNWRPQDQVLAVFACPVIVLILGLCALRIPELFDRSPVVTVDKKGFFDRRYTRRPVAWSEIDQLILPNEFSWPVIETHDEPANRTLTRRVFTLLGQPYLYVGAGGVDKSPGDILLAIDLFAPHLCPGE